MKRTPLKRRKRLTAKPPPKKPRKPSPRTIPAAEPVIATGQVARHGVPKDPGPWRSSAYIRFVRSKPCCVCGKPGPSEAHHWGGKGSHGTGQKCSDAMTAPLCAVHHRQWHDTGAMRRYRWAGHDCAVTSYQMTREESEAVQVKAQRDCLAEWIAGRVVD